jgi:glutaredoxin
MGEGTDSSTARVTLIGRPGCHLCEDAREVVERVTTDLGVGFTELSIDDDSELHAKYAEEIPVVLVDGEQHTFWRVDEARLRKALSTRSGRRRWPW